MSPDTNLDFNHLLLIGAGPGMGTAIPRRFGREGYRITLLSRGNKLEEAASGLREDGFPVQTVPTDVSHLDTYRSTLESLYAAPGAPGVLVYNAAMVALDDILSASVEHLETAYDVDVIGGIVAAQVAAPVMQAAGGGTILFTGGGFADYPVPAMASLSLGKAALRSAATLIAAGVADDGVHSASVTILGEIAPGTAFDPDTIAEMFWTAHTDSRDQWLTEYRYEGADAHAVATREFAPDGSPLAT